MAIVNAKANDLAELVAEDFVIVDFYSTTCAPCKMFARILEDLDTEIPFLSIVKVNISEYPELAKDYDIKAVPTILFFKDGEIAERYLGVLGYTQMKEHIAQYMYG